MYSTILVPIAFEEARDSNAALELAEALLAPGGTITALHVVEEVPNYASTYVDEALMTEARKSVEEALTAKLGTHATVTPRVVLPAGVSPKVADLGVGDMGFQES